MANPPADLFSDESFSARLRRELRNPSMISVILIAVVIVAIPTAIFIPKWVSTAKDSFEERNQDAERFNESILSITELVPGQIAPWMVSQINRMLVADTPFEWNQVSFTEGACFPGNLAQLPAGKYSDAVVQACTDMASIQTRHAGECPSVAICNFSAEAKAELTGVKEDLFAAFADSGFVLPTTTEQSVGP